MSKTHFSCAELAALRLPGMPTTKRRWIDLVTRESWPSQPRSGRGGGVEYLPPAPVRALIMAAQLGAASTSPSSLAVATQPVISAAGASVPAVFSSQALVPVDAAALDEAQRITRDARRVIREFVEAYPGSVKGAINHLNLVQADGLLTSHLAWAYEHCHDKKRAGQKLALKTYYNWVEAEKQRGTLAPAKKRKDFSVQPWHRDAIALKRAPQGHQLTWVVAELEKRGHAVSYHQARRFFLEKFSAIDQERHTGSQLRAKRFYQHRTAEGLAPGDEVHADGWNTHFSAPHPVTGEYVTYEVWHFHDVATRYVTPPGIGLTEQFEVIAKGLENFIRLFGRPLIVQTDSTKVVKGSDRFTKAVESLENRIGCTIVHPKEVGNSQANGICENFNTSWLDKQARELCTYQNPRQMDDLTYKRVRKVTGAMVRAQNAGDVILADAKRAEAERMGHGHLLVSTQEAIAWINERVEAYNDKPHRSLKKVRDPATGKLRHQTPREALAEHVASGWGPVAVDEDTLIDLFRPHKRLTVTRDTVSPYGGMRFKNSEVLPHWNGKEVVVAYDIHDYRRVWVKDLNGELICEAEFVAATGYRAQTAYEAAEEKRAKAQLADLENKKRRVEARRPRAALEHEDTRPLAEVIDMPLAPKKEELRDVREVLAELDQAPPAPAEATHREMTWEETKMWLYGPAEEPAPPEEAAAR